MTTITLAQRAHQVTAALAALFTRKAPKACHYCGSDEKGLYPCGDRFECAPCYYKNKD